MKSEAAELRNIRSKYQTLNGSQFFMSADADGTFLEAKNSDGELNEVARFHANALPEEMDFITSSLHMMGVLIRLVDRAIENAHKMNAQLNAIKNPNKNKNFAAEAAMKCEEPAFKAYLEQRHQLERPLTNERVASKLRSLLNITSRNDLNDDAAAAERWRSLRADYELWRRESR